MQTTTQATTKTHVIIVDLALSTSNKMSDKATMSNSSLSRDNRLGAVAPRSQCPRHTVPKPSNLLDLPNEILCQIADAIAFSSPPCSLLSYPMANKDLANFSTVNRLLRAIAGPRLFRWVVISHTLTDPRANRDFSSIASLPLKISKKLEVLKLETAELETYGISPIPAMLAFVRFVFPCLNIHAYITI